MAPESGVVRHKGKILSAINNARWVLRRKRLRPACARAHVGPLAEVDGLQRNALQQAASADIGPPLAALRCVVDIQRRHGSFSDWVWSHAGPGGTQIVNVWREMSQVPTRCVLGALAWARFQGAPALAARVAAENQLQ